ncbi:MAG: hypothetical protein WCG12_03605 [Alcaligenaceae bacterium]
MSDETRFKLYPTQLNEAVIINVGNELSDQLLNELRDLALISIQRDGNKAVIFLLAGLHSMDTDEYEKLYAISKMIRILGAQPFYVGLSSGIVAHLVNHDVEIAGVASFYALNQALAALNRLNEDAKAENEEDQNKDPIHTAFSNRDDYDRRENALDQNDV